MNNDSLKRFTLAGAFGLAALFGGAGTLAAQESASNDDLRRRIEELEKRVGGTEKEGAVGKGAERLLSTVDGATTLGGYGELHYNSPNSAPDVIDFHRFIFHITHRFDQRLSFVSEVELEHAFVQGGQGELELEQAYITYRMHEDFELRSGILLLPMGYVNRYHEPPTFYSVERPEFEKVIIPSTWFDGGVNMAWTPTPNIRIEAGVYGGLDATKFKAKDGVRSGRQKGFNTKAEHLAYAGRIEYMGFEDLHLGASFYTGNSNQTKNTAFGSANVTGVAGELVSFGRAYGLPQNEIRAEAAMFTIDDSAKIAANNAQKIPGRFWGFYIEDAYQVMGDSSRTEENALFLFARFEYLRNQSDMDPTVVADPTLNREKIVFGAMFRPHPRVAFKIDYEWIDDRSGVTPPNAWNLGVGYMF